MLRAAYLALALIFAPFAAEAHAIIIASVPAPKAVVPGPDVDVKLDFNSRIDKARSKVELVGPDKAAQRLPVAEDGPAGTLAGKATGLVPGAWRLHWQVLSVDGHITRGDIPFTVGPAP
jgi:methionine-rich copper-binding protein CopC